MSVATSTDTVTATVGRLDDFPLGTMKLATVGGRRVLVAHTDSGVHAIDNACPHQGYGLVTGTLVGDLVTCQWHNWKFCVTDGSCAIGEEDVACHRVTVNDDEVLVTVRTPTSDEQLQLLWPSLARAVARNYNGQMARDTARLLRAGASPADIVWTAIDYAAARNDYGVGHDMANAADCLQLVARFDDDERVLPVLQALAGLAEESYGYEPRPLPRPAEQPSLHEFAAAVESERHDDAVAQLLGFIEDGATPAELRQWLIAATSRHHLDYGHGQIWVQKGCELLEMVGWHRAGRLLPHVVTSIVLGTREDTLPYMRPSMKALAGVDLSGLANTVRVPEWIDHDGALRATLLAADRLPVAELLAAANDGAGVTGLLDTISLAASERLLRYDYSRELDPNRVFGWLDISHALTATNAARWAWLAHPGPHSARLMLWAAWLVIDSGRAERHAHAVMPLPTTEPLDGSLVDAIVHRRVDDAVRIAAHAPLETVTAALAQAALSDQAGSFIVAAHAVKMAVAAAAEAEHTCSRLPLVATARFLAAPRQERFVASTARQAIEFVRTGEPPRR